MIPFVKLNPDDSVIPLTFYASCKVVPLYGDAGEQIIQK